MSDVISRADAIEAVCKAVCEDDVSIFPACDQIKYCDEIQALLALPSADAVQGWIPCSERLPSKDGQYFVCMDYGQMDVYMWAEGWNCIRLLNGMVARECEINGVVAWMPLPEPYKTESEE